MRGSVWYFSLGNIYRVINPVSAQLMTKFQDLISDNSVKIGIFIYRSCRASKKDFYNLDRLYNPCCNICANVFCYTHLCINRNKW